MANDVKIHLAVEGAATAQDQFSRLDARLDTLNGTLVKTAHYGTALAGAFGLVLPALSNTVRAAIGAADAVTTLKNQLKLSTSSAAEAGQAYTALFDIAQKSRVSFTELGTTFASISRAGQELGISQARLLTVTQSIGNAMAISGGSAQGMQAALVQLGQGLSSGTLRGEELNSVMEQSPRLAKALADGLGVPLGELRKLGETGQLTAEQVIVALEKAGPQLAKEIETSVMTVGQAMTVLGNAATKFVGEMDQATNASSNLAAGIKGIASAIEVASAKGSVSFWTSDFKAAGEAMDRAKLQGAGFFGQMNQGAGMLIGRAAGLAFINRDFMTLSAAVADATVTLKRLDDQEQRDGKLSVYSMGERATAARDLARANRELAQSKNETVVSNTQQGIEASGKAREKYLASYAKALTDLDTLRNKVDKVPASYIKDMEEIIRLNQTGVLVGKDYTDMLAKQQKELLKKDDATKSGVATVTEAAKGLALYNDLLDQASGYTASYAEDQHKLAAAFKSGLIPSYAQYTKAVQALLDKQPLQKAKHDAEVKASKIMQDEYTQEQQALKELSDAQVANDNARAAGVKAVSTYADAIAEQNTYSKLELSLMGSTAVAREIALGQYRVELDLKKQIEAINSNPGFDADKKIIEGARARAAAAQATAGVASRVQMDDWKKSIDQYDNIFREGFAGMVNGGKDTWKSFTKSLATTFKTSVADQIYKSFAQPFVVKFVASMLGVTGAGSAMASEAGGGIASSLGISAAISKAGAYVAEGASTVASAILGFGADALAFEGGMAMMGSATGVTSFMAGAGQVMAAMGPVGWAALAAVAVIAAMGLEGGETRNGASYVTGTDGKAALQMGPSGGEIASKQAREMFDITKASIEGLLTGLGSKAVLTGFTAGLESSENGKGFAYAGGTINGVGFGESGGRDGGQFAMGNKTQEQALKDYQLNLTQSILEGLQVTADIPATVAKLISDGLNGAAVKDLTLEATNTILASVSKLSGEVSTFGAAMNLLPFASLKTLSFDTAAGLIAAAGGFEKLAANLGGFYQNFYTAAEQTAQLTTNTSKAFAALGLTMPALDEGARAAYRSMVELAAGQDLSITANAKAYTSLLALQGPMNELAPAFATVADAAKPAAAAVSEFAANMQKVTEGLQSTGASLQAQWDKLYLSEADYRTKQIAGMTDLQVAQYDTNAALQTSIDAFGDTAKAASAAADALADTAAAAKASAAAVTAWLQDLLAASREGIDAALAGTVDDVSQQKLRLTAIYDDQAAQINASLATVGLGIGKLRSLSDSLKSTLDGMRVSGSDQAYRAAAQAQIRAALATARSGGGLPVDGQLASALATVSKPSDQLYSNFVDYARDFHKTANDIAALGELAGEQLTADEITQKLLTSQNTTLKTGFDAEIKRLDALVVAAQAQADGVTKMTKALTSLSDALAKWADTLGATLADTMAKGFDAIDVNKSGGIAWDEFKASFGKMASEATLLTLFKASDYNGDGHISQLEAIRSNTANMLAVMSVRGSGGTAAPAATYTGTQVAEAAADMLAAGATTAAVINTASTGYGITSGSLATVAAALPKDPAAQAFVDYQKRIDAQSVFGAEERAAIVAEVSMRAAKSGLTSEAELYKLAIGNGYNAGMVDKAMGFANGSANAWATANGFPAFAQGINRVPYDMTARIHEGEAIVPKQFNPFNPNAQQSGDNSRLEALIDGLTREVIGLRAEAQATASHTNKTARLLDRAMPSGDAIATRVAV